MRKLCLLLSVGFIGFSYADNNVSQTAKIYAKNYLEVVYPTSPQIKKMSLDQAYNYYQNELSIWFRAPESNFPTGLFSDKIHPQYNVFLFPDTAARTSDQEKDIRSGFSSSKPKHGSNNHYIEVSSFGWMMFPYGTYYNYAKGSGIWLDTGGKTIVGYTKVDVMYKIYKDRKDIATYYQKLANIPQVNLQILGVEKSLTPELLNTLLKVKTAQEWESATGYRANIEKGLYSTIDPMVVSLMQAGEWSSMHKKLATMQKKGEPIDKIYLELLTQYTMDHYHGDYDTSKPRYRYMTAENNVAFDEWMYDEAKASGYNVVQMTSEPNAAGEPTFELCDVRWPKVTGIPDVGDNAIVAGWQAYDLHFAWSKTIQNKWLTVRNPFDVTNDREAYPIKMKFPAMNSPIESSVILTPPASYPKDWLPKNGWGVEQAKVNGYHVTDNLFAWRKLQPAPDYLKIPEQNNQGRFIDFGVNAELSNGFSFTDAGYNAVLLKDKVAKGN